jgi:glucose/arabinose dehydrogenase
VTEAWSTDFSSSGESIFGVAYRDTPDFLGERESAAALAIQIFRLREKMTDAPTGVFGPFDKDGQRLFVIVGHRRASREECSVALAGSAA